MDIFEQTSLVNHQCMIHKGEYVMNLMFYSGVSRVKHLVCG